MLKKGNSFRDKHKYEEALEYYNKAIKFDSIEAYARKGDTIKGLKKYEEALAEYKQGLEIDKNNIELLKAVKELENTID